MFVLKVVAAALAATAIAALIIWLPFALAVPALEHSKPRVHNDFFWCGEIKVPPERLTREYALGKAREVLRRFGNRRIVRFQILPDNQLGTLLSDNQPCRIVAYPVFLPGPPESLYVDWKTRWEAIRRDHSPAAELLRIGRSSVLRYLDSDGKVSATQLEGSPDPHFIAAGHYGGRITRLMGEEDAYLIVEVVGHGSLSENDGKELARSFARQTAIPSVSVLFRKDPWFGHSFPIMETREEAPAVGNVSPTFECWYRRRDGGRCVYSSPDAN